MNEHKYMTTDFLIVGVRFNPKPSASCSVSKALFEHIWELFPLFRVCIFFNI